MRRGEYGNSDANRPAGTAIRAPGAAPAGSTAAIAGGGARLGPALEQPSRQQFMSWVSAGAPAGSVADPGVGRMPAGVQITAANAPDSPGAAWPANAKPDSMTWTASSQQAASATQGRHPPGRFRHPVPYRPAIATACRFRPSVSMPAAGGQPDHARFAAASAIVPAGEMGPAGWGGSKVTARTVRIGGVTIGYRAEGDGPPVVIIASTGRGTSEFDALAERLAARGHRVLRPEPRGIAPSSGPMDGVSFHDFAADVAAVIRAEGGDPAVVAGHAYGNWIARTLAADHPDLVRGVALVAAGARVMPPAMIDALTMINDPGSSEAQRLAGLRLAFFAEGSDPRPWLDGWHPAVTASQRAARPLTDGDWRAAGSAPILDLQADADPFRPPESRDELRAQYGGRVTVRVIAGASHALPAEKPVETADAIADWAAGLGQAGLE